jgi:glycosyltransferase involved in cell wall biosynthesis
MGLKVLVGLGYYEVGGFKTVVDNLSKFLKMYGIDVTVAARVVKVNPPEYVNLIKLRPEDLPQEGRHYDIIHIHTSYPYTKVAVEHKLPNVVFTWHGYTPTIYVPGIRNKIINIVLKYAYKKLLPKIRYITSVSNYANKQLIDLFGIVGKIIPNGVDLELFKRCYRDLRARDRYPVILNLTAYNDFKGRDLLIRSFKVIKRKYGKAILLAVGINYNSFYNDIINLEYTPYDKLSQIYCESDFYLLTSKHESFGLPIVEAFATGTPVIAYDRDDARREHILSSGAGLLFKDDESLLQAVDQILDSWESYSSRGIEYAKRFDWRDIARRYIALYEKVLKNENYIE